MWKRNLNGNFQIRLWILKGVRSKIELCDFYRLIKGITQKKTI